MSKKMTAQRTVAGYPLKFEWHGGEYIDISFVGNESAFEVINTVDARGVPTTFTWANFCAEIDEWITDPEMDHANDLQNFYAYR